MELKRARDITRKFIKDGIEYEPILSSDWRLDKTELFINIASDINDIYMPFIPFTKLAEFIFDQGFNLSGNYILGDYYLTSIGLITEEEFYEAETMIELYKKEYQKKNWK